MGLLPSSQTCPVPTGQALGSTLQSIRTAPSSHARSRHTLHFHNARKNNLSVKRKMQQNQQVFGDTAAFPPFTLLLFPSFILPLLPALPHSWLPLAVSPFDHSPPPIPTHTSSASKDSWAGCGLPTQKESKRLKYSLQGLQTPALRARALCCSPNTT